MSPVPLAPSPRTQDKFSFEKATSGGVTFLALHGTLDHAFEGRKIAEAVPTKKLVVSLRDVRRFASWGMTEWMDFLRITAGRDLYLVECSSYAVSQINLVTGLLGHGKLVSFYAAYRCASCGEEHEACLIIPRDRAIIRHLPASHQECPTCGGHARLEEYPAAFFDKIADAPPYDIDDEVLAFLCSQLKYELEPDRNRFRAYRRVHKDYTYLRLSGNIAALPGDLLAAASEGTTVADLKDIAFVPSQVSEWRTYVRAALPKLRSLQLLDCPPGFLESAVAPEDLQDKLKVRTFVASYYCLRCEAVMSFMVDVAEHLEHLVAGLAPPAVCTTCQSALVSNLSPDQVEFMRHLPARDRDPALDKFLAAVRGEPPEKLENCLVALPPRPAAAAAGSRRILYAALALGLLILGGLVVVGFGVWKRGAEPRPAVQDPSTVVAPAKPSAPAFERPDWILSDVPSSSYCHDLINRLMCVGVSSYRPTRDEAAVEANDAALDELVSAIGLKISDPLFRESVMPGYSGVRAKALSAVQTADPDRGSAADAAAGDAVAKARKRVAEILRASGGAAVPSQRSDWYWEEYAAKKGGTETLVFVRYDVSLDAIKVLVEKYSAATTVLGSSVTTAFPGLAWQHADFTGGAMLIKADRALAEAGIGPQHVVMAVGEQRVHDAASFAKRVEEWKQASGDLALMVKGGDAPARMIEIRRRRVR